MPVRHVESFSFELPLDAVETDQTEEPGVVVTLGREAAESLHTDLGMALYPGGVGGADVPVQSGSVDLEDILRHLRGETLPDNGATYSVEPAEAAMTPEQAAAALQVQAARGYDPLPHYTPGEGGTTFGNQHV